MWQLPLANAIPEQFSTMNLLIQIMKLQETAENPINEFKILIIRI